MKGATGSFGWTTSVAVTISVSTAGVPSGLSVLGAFEAEDGPTSNVTHPNRSASISDEKAARRILTASPFLQLGSLGFPNAGAKLGPLLRLGSVFSWNFLTVMRIIS
jgi:hypothetical protein